MTYTRLSDLCATGMAIFAMFFGAGNIIYPLVLGQQALENTPYAILGFLLTAVLVPFCGLLAMFLYQGQVLSFFGRLGKGVAMFLAFSIIALLGPFGSTPRCIALAFSTLQHSYPGLNSSIFNAIACITIFFMAYKKQRLLHILGYLLTPLLLGLLALIVIKGLSSPSLTSSLTQINNSNALWKGLKEGYQTMDLLAAFFFAPVIINFTQEKLKGITVSKERFIFVLKASAIGAILLALVYIGFCFLAAYHAADLQNIPPEQLLANMALKILGSSAGVIVSLIVVLACLTTAVALIAAFAGFIHQEMLQGKGSYRVILALSLCVTYLIACFEFQGISRFLLPILEISYPILIVLTGCNLVEKLFQLSAKQEEESLAVIKT